MKKFYLLSVLLVLSFINIFVFAQSTSDMGDDSTSTINVDVNEEQKSQLIVQNIDAVADNDNIPSKVDANGNLTIRSGETYDSDINLSRGNLIIKDRALVFGNVYLGRGSVTVENDAEIKGNLVLKSGYLKIGNNVKVYGNISTYTIGIGDNVDITGYVDVVSSSGAIIVGSNSSIGKTLTSKAGLKIGSNGEVDLFLSGESAEIDGKVYKLGGKILSSGANTAVRLPFVPKLKNADGSEVMVMVNSPSVSTSVNSATNTTKKEENDFYGEDGDVLEVEEGDKVFYVGSSSLPEIDSIVNVDDINSYVEKVSSIDNNIKDLNLSSENVDMDYKVPAELFGFIPVLMSSNVKISKDKNVDVTFPWYSFMFSKPSNEKVIEDVITSAVKTSFDTNTVTTEGLSFKLQASITNSVLLSLKSLFDIKK